MLLLRALLTRFCIKLRKLDTLRTITFPLTGMACVLTDQRRALLWKFVGSKWCSQITMDILISPASTVHSKDFNHTYFNTISTGKRTNRVFLFLYEKQISNFTFPAKNKKSVLDIYIVQNIYLRSIFAISKLNCSFDS